MILISSFSPDQHACRSCSSPEKGRKLSLCIALAWLLALPLSAGAGQIILDEEFNNLDNWAPLAFPKIPRHSSYEIRETATGNVLEARSNGSASAIRYIHEFDVYRYPIVKWRWKIGNVYSRGNVQEKAGDDYPLRVYVMFKYDPERASFGERAQYGLAKILYGAYPPQSSLNYIWASRQQEQGIYPSPFTDKAQLFVLRAGSDDTGKWLDEQINILDDYQKAFGELPPATASIAIMNDSDNTGESSVSYMDYIRVQENK